MADTRFAVLGAVSIDGGTAPVVGKRRRLLALLLCRPQQVLTTDWLIDELWGDEPPASARNALHGHITALRKLVDTADARVLATHGNGYRLDTADIDWLHFDAECEAGEAAMQRGEHDVGIAMLDRALHRWRDEPYDAATEPTDVLGRHATRLRETYRRAHLTWGVPALLTGPAGVVVERCARARHLFPFDEGLAALHAVALADSGRAVEAIESLRQLRTRLRHDLGLSPGLTVAALEVALLDHTADRDSLLAAAHFDMPAVRRATARSGVRPPGQRPGLPTPTHAVCVGRDELIGRWLDAPRSPATRTWLIGPAGRGKTRVLTEMAARATALGYFVAYCPADDGDALRAVRGLLGSTEVDAALRRLADAATPRAEVDAHLAGLAMHRRGDDALVWLIDDADRLSSADRAVVMRVLTAAPDGLHVVLASRFRPPASLASLVDAADLSPLRVHDVLELAADLPPDVASSIADASAGEPLLATTLVRLANAAADTPAVMEAATVADALAEALSRLYGQADQSSQHLAGLLAVADAPVRVDALAIVLDDVAHAVTRGVASGLVALHDDTVALTHSLLREQIVRQLPRHIAEHLAHVAARLLQASTAPLSARRESTLVGDNTAATRRALTDAGAVALRSLALDEAAAIGALLIEISPPNAPSRIDGELLLESAGVDLRDADRVGRRLDLWERCIAAGDLRQMCSAAALALGQWQDSTGPSPAFETLLQRSVALAVEQPAARAELLATAVASRLGAGAASLIESLEALTLADQVEDAALTCRALVARCYALIGGGHVDERLRLASTALDLAQRRGLAQATVAAAAQLFIAATTSIGPHSQAAQRAIAAHVSVAESTARPLHHWRRRVVDSAVAMHDRDWEAAAHHADAAVEFGRNSAVGDAVPTRVVQELFFRLAATADHSWSPPTSTVTPLGSRRDPRPLVIASHLAVGAWRATEPSDSAMIDRLVDALQLGPADYLRPAALWLGCWYAATVGDSALLATLRALDTSGAGGVVVAMGVTLPGPLPHDR